MLMANKSSGQKNNIQNYSRLMRKTKNASPKTGILSMFRIKTEAKFGKKTLSERLYRQR